MKTKTITQAEYAQLVELIQASAMVEYLAGVYNAQCYMNGNLTPEQRAKALNKSTRYAAKHKSIQRMACKALQAIAPDPDAPPNEWYNKYGFGPEVS